jgi:hypothetical protein
MYYSDEDEYSSSSSSTQTEEDEEEYLENVSILRSETYSEVDTDTDNDTETNSNHSQIIPIDYYEDNEIIDQIFSDEIYLLESEKIIGKYYIGVCLYNIIDNEYIILCVISLHTFYKYSYYYLNKYISEISFYFTNSTTKIQLMKHTEKKRTLDIVVLKTFWLKIVQRTWKRVFKERIQIIKELKSPLSLRYSEIHGHFEKRLPSIYGMLKQQY